MILGDIGVAHGGDLRGGRGTDARPGSGIPGIRPAPAGHDLPAAGNVPEEAEALGRCVAGDPAAMLVRAVVVRYGRRVSPRRQRKRGRAPPVVTLTSSPRKFREGETHRDVGRAGVDRVVFAGGEFDDGVVGGKAAARDGPERCLPVRCDTLPERRSLLERTLRKRYIGGMAWTVETVSGVDAEIEALPVKLRARLVRLLETIENVGLGTLREPHVKHLEGKLWELRVRAQGGPPEGST